MECVRVRFAPDTEAWRAKNLLRRAVRGVNRMGVWPAFYPDFFAFAEVPIDIEEEDAPAPELPEGAAEGSETIGRVTELPDTQAPQAPDMESPQVPDTEAPQVPDMESHESAPQNSETSENTADVPQYTGLAIPESPFFCILLAPTVSREALHELMARAEDVPMSFSPLTWEEAEDFYREALESTPEDISPEAASAREHLALLLSDTGRVGEAEALFREALETWRRLSERDAVAETCGNLARLLHGTGRFEEAEKLYCEAMDLYRELSKRSNDYQPPLARVCQDLALCLEERGRPEAAEWFYRTSLDLWRRLAERAPEAYAPRVAETCGNLAGLLKAIGRAPEAAGLYRIALDTYSRLARENPPRWEPSLAVLYENLAAFEAARSPSAGKALLRSAYLLYQKYPDLSDEAIRVQSLLRE